MASKLNNKVAVITGASRGLGRCLCNHFSSLGVKVAAVARNIEELKTLEKEIKSKGNEILCYQLDITDFDGIERTVERITEKWGTIDILINNAGTNVEDPLEKLEKKDIDSVIDTNLKGTIYFTRLITPVMIKSKKGYIINISSIGGIRGNPDYSIYSASKFGVNGFGDSISKYLMKYNIHVVTLCPGGINTTWWDKEDYVWGDRNKLIKPEQIAELLEFILNSDSNILFKNVIFIPVIEIE